MEKRSRGRPRTATPDQKREEAKKRQRERRRRVAEDGGRSITLTVPGDILETLDAETQRRGIPRSEVLLEAVRAQILGSESATAAPLPQIHGSGTAVADSKPNPGYRGRALLLAAAVGAVLGSWLTLALN